MNDRSKPGVSARFLCATGALLVLAIAALSGCAHRPVVENDHFSDSPPNVNQIGITNVLREGDVVRIEFDYSTNFNTIQRVSLDGTLNLQHVGLVKAANRTAEQLQAELGELYKSHVKEEQITVNLVSSITCVYVSGAVLKPGRVPMERPMTALEAIMEAGGFDPIRGRLSRVTILRVETGKQNTYHLDLKQILEGRDRVPFYVEPFDIIHVPLKTVNF